jgi:hypothetical protein
VDAVNTADYWSHLRFAILMNLEHAVDLRSLGVIKFVFFEGALKVS